MVFPPFYDSMYIDGKESGVWTIIIGKFEEIWRIHNHELYRYICCCVQQPADAEDILQEVALKSYTAWASLRNMSSAKTWLFAITRNTVKDYYSQRSKWKYTDFTEVDRIIAEQEASVDIRIVMDDFIRQLPSEWARMLYLNIYYGASAKEIADITGVKHFAVSKRLTRMKQILRRALEGVNEKN